MGPVASAALITTAPRLWTHWTRQTVTPWMSSQTTLKTGSMGAITVHCASSQFRFHYRSPICFSNKIFLWSFTAREECCGRAWSRKRRVRGECQPASVPRLGARRAGSPHYLPPTLYLPTATYSAPPPLIHISYRGGLKNIRRSWWVRGWSLPAALQYRANYVGTSLNEFSWDFDATKPWDFFFVKTAMTK